MLEYSFFVNMAFFDFTTIQRVHGSHIFSSLVMIVWKL